MCGREAKRLGDPPAGVPALPCLSSRLSSAAQRVTGQHGSPGWPGWFAGGSPEAALCSVYQEMGRGGPGCPRAVSQAARTPV